MQDFETDLDDDFLRDGCVPEFPNLANSSRFQYKILPEREVAPPHKTLKTFKSLSSDGWMGITPIMIILLILT